MKYGERRNECLEQYNDRGVYVFCTRQKGHKGKHRSKLRDYAVSWNQKMSK